MKHSFTSFSIAGPSQETIFALQLFARAYTPKAADNLENRWFDEHTLTSKAV